MSEPRSRRAAREARKATTGGAAAHNPTPRAGRNLYAAIGVGVLLGLIVILSLFLKKEIFVGVAMAAAVIGCVELLRALTHGELHPPAVPTLVSAAAIPLIAYVWGASALAFAVVVAALLTLVWRSLDHPDGMLRDMASGSLIVLYVPALVGFAMLLLAQDDGPQRIVVFILVTICSDIGGYIVGVVAGKHPMAPSVSPKKSWEGFAGSVTACVVGGALGVWLILDGRWWVGALLGALAVVAATVGDLCESMIKRDLGIKDMSNLIPGHGGLMDRLDSLLVVVPVAWAVLTPLVAVT
ncbi:phosphatidate cytidylyltransferase [Flexivirga oryzae]|uniref:Phosphatidate cytidylyltransferase n=1 Tax=Flexivirga oryzae TaxID=1794944 RepID=A0A839N9Q8_9MICO|nr:phosphatidate cytidylyltransferase [Flexivirga oryzae]MBB2892386.1 phosphatidate cytidylyltransferase [Flexivirga oryzae]